MSAMLLDIMFDTLSEGFSVGFCINEEKVICYHFIGKGSERAAMWPLYSAAFLAFPGSTY